jgi:hypothetical protein
LNQTARVLPELYTGPNSDDTHTGQKHRIGQTQAVQKTGAAKNNIQKMKEIYKSSKK